VAGFKLNSEDLNKLTDEEKKSDELYQKAFVLNKIIQDKYKECCCAKHFTEKNGKSPEELLFNDPDYKELFIVVDEIIAMPHRRFSISFDEYGSPKESRNISGIVGLQEIYVESLLSDKKYDEAVSLCKKISKLLDVETPACGIHSSLSSYENGMVGNILKVPSDRKYIEHFRFFLATLDKTGKDLPDKMIQYSILDNYSRTNKYLTGQYQKKSERIRIFEYFLIGYFGRPYIRKALYTNLESSIRQAELFRIDDQEEILKTMNDDNTKFNIFFPFLYSYDPPIARYKIFVDLRRQALALKIFKAEHGAYPEKLEEIIPGIMSKLPTDYFSGKNFVYRKNGEGFILYSIGKNKKDDGGENNYHGKDKEDDITCRCEN
jgi:hypothetical protein